jgi:hypothetical protein
MRRLLMRVFSVAWADDGAQEQVDRDTPVSRTPTVKGYEAIWDVQI